MSKEEIKISKEICLDLFSSGAYFTVNKKLLVYYGPDITIFLTNLMDKYKYHLRKNALNDDKWFYATHEDQYKETGLTLKKIQNCKKKLLEDNIIAIKRMYVPAKEHYSFNWEYVMKLLNTIDEHYSFVKTGNKSGGNTSPDEKRGLDLTKSEDYNNNNKDTNNKKLLEDSQNNLNRLFIESSLSDDDGNSGSITSKLFGKFWELYPNKKGSKGKALTAWNKLCAKKSGDRPAWRILRRAVIQQKKSEQWQNPAFIPLASTWLNQSRWLDNPDEMKAWTKKDWAQAEQTRANTKTKKSGFVGKDKLDYGQTLKIKV